MEAVATNVISTELIDCPPEINDLEYLPKCWAFVVFVIDFVEEVLFVRRHVHDIIRMKIVVCESEYFLKGYQNHKNLDDDRTPFFFRQIVIYYERIHCFFTSF